LAIRGRAQPAAQTAQSGQAVRRNRGRSLSQHESLVAALVLLLALLLTGCSTKTKGSTATRSETVTTTVTTPGTRLASYLKQDPAGFPKLASHLAFNFGDGSTNAHFALNVVRGCNPTVADRSFRLNPKQVNFIVPGTTVPAKASVCGDEDGLAVTYGNGYWKDSSVIRSPYRGIGTIRAFNGDEDIAHYEDGTRAFSDGDWVLNMFSSGSRNSTAEWAARLKAHWTLADLGGSSKQHPGVQGVWGDNFLWWNPSFDKADSSDGSPLAGSAAQWNDGLVRNHRTLQALLGPDFLLGGNGAAWACSGYVSHDGTSRDGACTAADAGMWEDAGALVYDAAGWDRYIPYFDEWIKAGVAEGRQKYGVMAQFGTCGVGNLGHPLTPTDERLGLAMATIGGIDLWAVHDCDWESTVVPGGQFSIPEMGDSSDYPRGWLGQATSDPIRVDLGMWKRTFTGGSVYANLTSATWNVGGVTVPARDALFVKS
jgi:hypothetical protein